MTNEDKGTFTVKKGLAQMLKGGVIMDVVTPEHARIAEEAGAVAVMALERVPSDIRAAGGVARMSDPAMIVGIMDAVSIPVMAKARIGHFVEAQVLEALGVDYVDESEVLTPADEANHIDKWQYNVPFVCGATNLGEALRRIGEVAQLGKLPVVLFTAGGIATPADAAMMMQLGAEGVFVGSGIFKSGDPAKRAEAIVRATTDSGAEAVTVRRTTELDTVDGLVIPGGESTTIGKLAAAFDLLEPLRKRIAGGLPTYGSCAGMILLADRVLDGVPGQETLGGLDVTVRRNAFGRQVDSFEEPIAMAGVPGEPVHAVFIRAPWVGSVGDGVEVLGKVEVGPAAGRIVAVRQGGLLATSFHPELAGDARVHALFVQMVEEHLMSEREGSQRERGATTA